MDTHKRIKELEAEIKRLRGVQYLCAHKWGSPYRDYDEKAVPIQENRPMGSDFFNPVTVAWETKQIPVWRRKCQDCGKLQSTQKEEPVVERYKPCFDA